MAKVHLNTQFAVIVVEDRKENQLNVLPNTDENTEK